jgi:hypothetical protein
MHMRQYRPMTVLGHVHPAVIIVIAVIGSKLTPHH